ncbi:MAG: TlpA family protein disulfide reductase, partial [Thermomicrobiales bacterium]
MRRLAIGSFVLAALMLPFYLLVLKPEKALEPGFSNAALIDTPAAAGQQKVGLKVGELAPNFAISTTDGGRITLAELRGKPVLISFFALWCGSCLSEMPIIDSVHERRG